jgi:hypothetical protein
MNLTNDLFEQIVTTLAAGEATTLPSVVSAPATAAEQRRASRRFAADPGSTARLIPLTDKLAPFPFDVSVRDVSPGGVGFLHVARIPLDEQFVLLLPSQDGDVAILCAVAYWQPLAKDVFAIGARFTRVLRQGSGKQTPMPLPDAAPVRRAV